MNTNLELYKTFYYVAKNGNITQAANELMISQPAVSKAIKTLEEELDTQLFNRKNNGVSLTTAGELIYNKIKRSMELIISAEEDLVGLNNMEYGNINIGAGNTIIQKYLMPIIEEFHNKYPNIKIKIHTLTTSELIKKAQIGLIDIVFTHFPNTFPNNFETYKIMDLHDTFVVNKNSKLINKTITKKDISELPLILLPATASNRKSFDQFCTSNDIVIKPLMEIGNDIIIEDAAISGLGVGLVNKEYVLKELNDGTLIELKTNFKFGEKYLGYAVDSNRMNNIIIQNFIKLLK